LRKGKLLKLKRKNRGNVRLSKAIHKLTLVVFSEQYAEILWVGNHDDYDNTFKGNKNTIETWLRNHGKIK